MTHTAQWRCISLTLFAALCGFTTRIAAQEGVVAIDGTPRHGYYFTSRPHVSLFIYCGFSNGRDQEAFVFRRTLEGNKWARVGACNSSHAKGSDSIAIGDATMHFVFVSTRKTSPAPDGAWSGTKTIAKEASNDCGLRLKYSDSNGKIVRLVLLDHSMAFGHGVPITPVCDPLLDHYDHF